MRVSNQTVLLIGLLVVVFVLTDTLKVRKARRLSKLTRRNTTEKQINFSCLGRPTGYYADYHDFDCRVFYICDNFGRRVPMFCPALTKFNQIVRVCDWADNVDCAETPNWYYINGVQPHQKNSNTTST